MKPQIQTGTLVLTSINTEMKLNILKLCIGCNFLYITCASPIPVLENFRIYAGKYIGYYSQYCIQERCGNQTAAGIHHEKFKFSSRLIDNALYQINIMTFVPYHARAA